MTHNELLKYQFLDRLIDKFPKENREMVLKHGGTKETLSNPDNIDIINYLILYDGNDAIRRLIDDYFWDLFKIDNEGYEYFQQMDKANFSKLALDYLDNRFYCWKNPLYADELSQPIKFNDLVLRHYLPSDKKAFVSLYNSNHLYLLNNIQELLDFIKWLGDISTYLIINEKQNIIGYVRMTLEKENIGLLEYDFFDNFQDNIDAVEEFIGKVFEEGLIVYEKVRTDLYCSKYANVILIKEVATRKHHYNKDLLSYFGFNKMMLTEKNFKKARNNHLKEKKAKLAKLKKEKIRQLELEKIENMICFIDQNGHVGYNLNLYSDPKGQMLAYIKLKK